MTDWLAAAFTGIGGTLFKAPDDLEPIELTPDDDLPCPWCFSPTAEADVSCPMCHRHFG